MDQKLEKFLRSMRNEIRYADYDPKKEDDGLLFSSDPQELNAGDPKQIRDYTKLQTGAVYEEKNRFGNTLRRFKFVERVARFKVEDDGRWIKILELIGGRQEPKVVSMADLGICNYSFFPNSQEGVYRLNRYVVPAV